MHGTIGWSDLVVVVDTNRAPPQAVLEYQAAAIAGRTNLFANVRPVLGKLARRQVPMAIGRLDPLSCSAGNTTRPD